MNEAAYLAMQERVELISRLLLETDPKELDEFAAAGEHADTVAPFRDPTAYMKASSKLRMVIQHARAIASARRFVLDAAKRAGELPADAR